MRFRCVFGEFWVKLTVDEDLQRCLCTGWLFESQPAATFWNNSKYPFQFGAFATEKTLTDWSVLLFLCCIFSWHLTASMPQSQTDSCSCVLALITPSRGEFLALHCQITHIEEQADLPKWSKYESCYYMKNTACKALSSFRASVILFWGNHAI